jgi:NADH-quinone oxidoreductase subunit G
LRDHAFYDVLSKAERPLVILGSAATARDDGAAVLGAAMALASELGAQYSMLHTAASRVGGMEVGCVPGEDGRDTDQILVGAASGAVEVVYLLGADEIDMETLGKAFVIYQGHHGDAGAHRADVILPSAAYAEQSGLYVNMEGRPQMAYRAAFPPGDAKEDWAILRALSERLGDPLPFDTIDALRAQMFEAVPHLQTVNAITAAEFEAAATGSMGSAPFVSPITDFYLTNPIARASETMAACSALAQQKATPLAAE